jgi:hypothetical protein
MFAAFGLMNVTTAKHSRQGEKACPPSIPTTTSPRMPDPGQRGQQPGNVHLREGLAEAHGARLREHPGQQGRPEDTTPPVSVPAAEAEFFLALAGKIEFFSFTA